MVYTSHFGDFTQLIQASSQELSPRAKQHLGRGTIGGGRELMGGVTPSSAPTPSDRAIGVPTGLSRTAGIWPSPYLRRPLSKTLQATCLIKS